MQWQITETPVQLFGMEIQTFYFIFPTVLHCLDCPLDRYKREILHHEYLVVYLVPSETLKGLSAICLCCKSVAQELNFSNFWILPFFKNIDWIGVLLFTSEESHTDIARQLENLLCFSGSVHSFGKNWQ